MVGFLAILVMSALLGAGSFGTGMMPLVVAFSKSSMASLTAYGTGLLLGAALGVVIPEGIESLVASQDPPHWPGDKISIALLTGFIFMLVVELRISHSTQGYHTLAGSDRNARQPRPDDVSTVEFDVELGELEREQGIESQPSSRPGTQSDLNAGEGQQAAYPLTLGLVLHALADGLALGSAALSDLGNKPDEDTSFYPSGLSLVVFLALAIHKAPTALALTTSLLATSLPVEQCKKHLAIFSAATPVGTVLSYTLLSISGYGASGRSQGPGFALLFSGGSFLYVATVLQPSLPQLRTAAGELEQRMKLFLTITGMLTPYVIVAIVGGGHSHS
ncbi:Zinc/iron permease [Daedaleopsis nitida]|nr:Zinc/iron permease [Daedaleopsis nitida]